MKSRRRHLTQEQPINFNHHVYDVDAKDGQRLLMSRQRLTQEFVTAMCEYLKQHPKITKLNLSSSLYETKEDHTWFTKEGIALIGALPTLTNLDMCFCRLNDEALTTLSQSASTSAINYLALTGNDIENPESLRVLPKLEWLFLNSNPITTAGATALLQFPALEYISINDSNIGDEGAKALATSRLATLLIGNCEMSHEGMKALLANKTFIEFDLFDKQLEKEYKKPIEEMLNRNKSLVIREHFFNHFKADQDQGRSSDQFLDEYAHEYDQLFNQLYPENNQQKRGIKTPNISPAYREKVEALLNAYQRGYRYFNLFEHPNESNYLSTLPVEIRRMTHAYTDSAGLQFFGQHQKQDQTDNGEDDVKLKTSFCNLH